MLELADFRDKIIGKKAYVWLFNIGAEKVWFSLPNTIGKESNDFFMGVEYMNLLLCQEQDYVIFRRPPNWKFLNYLRRQGICIPNIIWLNNSEHDMTTSECILHDSQILELLTGLRETHVLMPYAITHFIEEIAIKTGISIVGAEEKVSKSINNKVFARLLSQELGYTVCEGKIFQNVSEAFEYYKRYLLQKKVILKKAFGTCGSGLYIIENENQFKSIERRAVSLELNDKCILEKFYDSKIDINYQIYISRNGNVTIFSLKQQLINNTKYIGSIYPLDIEGRLYNEICAQASRIGKKLYDEGYWGIASIDGMLINDTIIPIVEINGRMSLSTYTSFFINQICYSIMITKYYDYYIQYINHESKISELIELVEKYNNKHIKIIIYAYTIDPVSSINHKNKCRVYLMYMGNDYMLIKTQISNFEFLLNDLNNKNTK